MASGLERMPQTQGAILLGVAFSVGLYGITCAQTFWYYQVYAGDDAMWLKVLTGLLWFLNTIHTGIVINIPYFYLITAANNPGMRSEITWYDYMFKLDRMLKQKKTGSRSLPASSIVLAFVSFLVYIYYIRRLWLLSKRNLIICGLVAVLSVGHFVSTSTFGMLGLVGVEKTIREYMDPHSSMVLKIATSFGTSTDLLTALATCWCLSRSRTGYKDTDSTISVIMTYTINTGLLAAMCVLCSLISLIAWPESYLAIFFLFLIAPLETNSCLGSLNAREYFHRHGQMKCNTVGLSNFHPTGSSIPAVEIRVNRTMDTYRFEASHITDDKSNLSVELGACQNVVVENTESNVLPKS